METILGLLLVLLPLVFKLVEKKLKSSGHVATAEKVHEWAELFGNDKDDDSDEEDVAPAPVQTAPVVHPVEPHHPVEAPRAVSPQPRVQQTPVKPMAPRTRKPASKPMLVEEKTEKKEKIDPKKLVIYSEIMKPKF